MECQFCGQVDCVCEETSWEDFVSGADEIPDGVSDESLGFDFDYYDQFPEFDG